MKKHTQKHFIEMSIKIHKNKYAYDKVVYINTTTLVSIYCNDCAEYFEQFPKQHIKGNGCRKCQYKYAFNARRLTTEEFVNKAKNIHYNTYDYSCTEYLNSRTKVIIKCNKCSKEFKQSPTDHISGKGCSYCSVGSFKKDKPAVLYYLSINDGQAYKIGVTGLSVMQRFSSTDLAKIKVIKTVNYATGEEAYIEEQRILKEFAHMKYTGSPLLDSHGNTELFKIDVLSLDIVEVG